MAFWKKSDDNGNLKSKIVRPRTGQGYWGARPADEPSQNAVEDPFAKPQPEGADASGLESKPMSDSPSDAGFKSFAPTAEASVPPDGPEAAAQDEPELAEPEIAADFDDGSMELDEPIEAEFEDEPSDLTEQAGDYLEPDADTYVDASADFIEEEDDLSREVDEANAALSEFTTSDPVEFTVPEISESGEPAVEPSAPEAVESSALESEETVAADDFNLLDDEMDESFWQDPVDTSYDDVATATVDDLYADSDADADIDEVAPEDLVETAETDPDDAQYASPAEDVAEVIEDTSEDTPETVEEATTVEDNTPDPEDTASKYGRWGGPMAAAGAVGGLATAAALSSQDTDDSNEDNVQEDVAEETGAFDATSPPEDLNEETSNFGSEDDVEHQELTEPAEYADETVEETTDFDARSEEMAEAIDEDVDDAFDETSDQTDDSAETVAGDGELEAEFEAVETTAENETDNVIAWPLSQADADEIPSDSADLLTEEERAAIEAVTGDESVETEDDEDVAVATAIPVDKPADFAEEPDEDYNANMIAESSDELGDEEQAEDNGGAYYYTAAPTDANVAASGGGRRTALYLAGAASLSTICAVGYFLLQNRDTDPAQTNIAASDPAEPAAPASVAETSTSELASVETTSTETEGSTLPEIDFGFLNTTDAPAEDSVTVPEDELFEADPVEAAETETVDPLEPTTRELSGPQTTLASVENGEPAATADTVVETEVPPQVVMPEPAPAPSPKPVEPPTQLAEADAPSVPTAPLSAPESLAEASAPEVSAQPDQEPVAAAPAPKPAPVAEPAPAPAPRVAQAAPSVASVSQPATLPSFSGEVAPNAAAAWPLDQFEARGSTLTEADKTRFAEMFHRAFDTTRDNARTSITTANGDRASLQFGDSVTQMRAMPIQRAANLDALPDSMNAETGWYTTTDTASLAASPNQDASTIARLTPSTAVQKLGVVEQADGDRWYAIGRDGVVVGFVHAEYLAPVTPGASAEQSLVVPASATLTETVNVVTPCRDLTMSVGGTSTTGVGCLSPNGQWVMSEAPAQAVAAIAPPAQPAPLAAASPSQSKSLFAGGVAGIDEETADILFSRVNDRRTQRHGRTVTSQRLNALLDDGRSITVARNGDHYSRIRIAPASVQSLQTVSDTLDVSSQTCRIATYITADATREMTACRQSNGNWRVVSRRGAPYQVRTVASIS